MVWKIRKHPGKVRENVLGREWERCKRLWTGTLAGVDKNVLNKCIRPRKTVDFTVSFSCCMFVTLSLKNSHFVALRRGLYVHRADCVLEKQRLAGSKLKTWVRQSSAFDWDKLWKWRSGFAFFRRWNFSPPLLVVLVSSAFVSCVLCLICSSGPSAEFTQSWKLGLSACRPGGLIFLVVPLFPATQHEKQKCDFQPQHSKKRNF